MRRAPDHSARSAVQHGALANSAAEHHAALSKAPLASHPLVREGTKHLRAYVRAHADVGRARERLLAKHTRKGRSLDLEILALDEGYQRLRADLRAETGFAPGAPTLSGRVSILGALRAIHAAHHLAPKHREFADGAQLLLAVAASPEAARLAKAHEARAQAVGPAMRAMRTIHLDAPRKSILSDGSGADAGASSSSSDYASSVVKILINDQFEGTGFFVRQTVIVTAAHVIKNAASSAVRVLTANGDEIDVDDVRVNSQWSSTRSDLDAAVILVSNANVAGLPVLWNFAGSGGTYDVARYGYPSDGAAQYGSGQIHRGSGRYFTPNADLQVPAGASGCPILYESGGTISAVGIGTARSEPSDTNAFIGIPMLNNVIPNN